MLLREIVEASGRVAAAPGRLEKIGLLGEALRRAAPGEVETAVQFLTGRIRQGRIGIGGAAVGEARPSASARESTLTLAEVDAAFARIAQATGKGSARAKVELLRGVFARATEGEASFLLGLLFGELRQGALEGLMAEAIAKASGAPVADVRRAVMAEGDMAAIARVALAEGPAALSRFAVRLFRPVRPMLAQPADGVEDALARLGEAALEWKLDGARVQVHKAGEVVRVYSRALREVTPAVPEVVEAALALPAREIILDGEAIALRPDGAPHPFQVTMRRFGRKLEVEAARAELPLTPFFFDLLYVDGRAMIDEPEARRAAALEELAHGVSGGGLVIPRAIVSDPAVAEAFLQEALRAGHEGIMAKARDAAYEAGARGRAWLKIKAAHTLDLVVLAAEWGHGRRKGWLSNLHLGARDPDKGGFVMLGKTFKGLTDETLAWQTRELLAREIGKDGITVHVRPELVVEVAFNDVQASPRYPGGVALRFARVKRYRDDKAPGEADTIAAVREILMAPRKGT